MRRTVLAYNALLLVLVISVCPAWAADTVLQNGVPFNTSLPALTYANGYLDVPEGATKLTVTVTNGSGDLDLYMKFGSRLTGGTLGELQASADVMSEGLGANETIVLTQTTTPPLRAGRWYIATLNLNNATTNFTLTGTYEARQLTTVPGASANLSLAANDTCIVPWGFVSLGYRIKSFRPGTKADLYLAVVLENGAAYFIDSGFALTANVAPFARDIPLEDGETRFLSGMLPGELPETHFTFYGVLVAKGADLFSPAAWLSEISSLTISMGNLSGEQQRVLSELGNPQAAAIVFDRGRQERSETWLYQAGGGRMETTYNFINGSRVSNRLSSLSEGGYRASSKKPAPALFGPGQFSPATTTGDMLRLFGDPDLIKDGTAQGARKWFYNSVGVSVTIQDGLIEKIEVH